MWHDLHRAAAGQGMQQPHDRARLDLLHMRLRQDHLVPSASSAVAWMLPSGTMV